MKLNVESLSKLIEHNRKRLEKERDRALNAKLRGETVRNINNIRAFTHIVNELEKLLKIETQDVKGGWF